MLICQADAIRLPFADMSCDLVLGSPPYCDARTYGIGAQRGCREWIEWMLDVTTECLRVSRGAVVWVAAGVTRDRNYWPACEGLIYEWWKRGGSMYRPCYFHRVGIPGGGGDQWFRGDVEHVMCFKRSGKLSWSDNLSMGHPPKWAPGGEMSYRLADGTRRNQWGGSKGSHGDRDKEGILQKGITRPSHYFSSAADGSVKGNHDRDICAIANPGNLIHCKVGGGHMGDRLSHESVAPFPEKLAEWFVRSLCPPDGIVYDPFSGSGTTAKVAVASRRRYLASDIRLTECEKTRRRVASVQVELF